MSASICTAKGKGWSCDGVVIAKGLCPSHYRQMARGQALAPIQARRAHMNKRVRVNLDLEAEDADAVAGIAKKRGVTSAEVYRWAVAAIIKTLG